MSVSATCMICVGVEHVMYSEISVCMHCSGHSPTNAVSLHVVTLPAASIVDRREREFEHALISISTRRVPLVDTAFGE